VISSKVERFIYAEKVVCSSRISPKKEKEEKEREGKGEEVLVAEGYRRRVPNL